MESLFSQNLLTLFPHTLLAPSFQGFGSVFLLFLLCFLGVHVAKFAVRGWRLYDGAEPVKPPEKPPEKPAENKTDGKQSPPEAIYYIVEKKRRRSKPSYGEPKEIRFK